MPTIVPLTSEAQWIDILATTQRWNTPLRPAVVLAPHPDDETLGCGGMIARLRAQSVPVTILAITDGENAYACHQGLGAIRVVEQVEALRRLEVPQSSIHRLQLPDGDVASFEDSLVDSILSLVSAGDHLVAPWPHDFHPDHEAAGRAAERVAQMVDIDLTYYLFWTWHRGSPASLHESHLVMLPLTEGERSAKIHALQAHASQFEHADGQPILSADLIKPAERSFEVYIR